MRLCSVRDENGQFNSYRTGQFYWLLTLPEIPTIAEAGVPGYQSTGWAGVLAPKGTPKPVLDKLHAALLKVMSQPDTREQIGRLGADPVTSTPVEFARLIREDWDRFGQAIKAAKIKVE